MILPVRPGRAEHKQATTGEPFARLPVNQQVLASNELFVAVQQTMTRKITSLTALLSFALLFLNSIVLYMAPHGRIAYWADWRFLGLTKTEWTNQHIIVGLLFLFSILLHIYFNWRPIIAYLKNKAKQLKIFTLEFTVSFILVIIFTIGSYIRIPPLHSVITFSESLKNSAAEKYGEPPYGRAELSSLKIFATKTGLNLDDGRDRLRKAGVLFYNDNETLLNIANRNNTSPDRLYRLMQAGNHHSAAQDRSPLPLKNGSGNHRLAAVCDEYDLSVALVMEALTLAHIKAAPEETLRQIAERNNTTPREILDIIKRTAAQPRP